MAHTNVEVRKWIGGGDVGCKRDAIAALAGTLPQIGRGFCRITYKGARGIVYKVPRNPARDRSNVSEYERMTRIAKFDRSLSTPTALYIVDGVAVIAMYERPISAAEEDFRAMTAWGKANAARVQARVAAYNAAHIGTDRIGDMHEGNWRGTVMGRPTLTDVGDVV